jgi:hypothetical protein
MCFDKTGLMKPHTSRPANSERYWIGSGFRSAPEWIIQLFRTLTATDAPNGWNHLFAELPYFPVGWITEIQAFQEQVELHQFRTIQLTLNLIRTPSKAAILDLLTQNICNSRDWCARHNLPLNRRYLGLSDEQVALANLEEALVPFQASAARTNLPGLSRPPPTDPAGSMCDVKHGTDLSPVAADPAIAPAAGRVSGRSGITGDPVEAGPPRTVASPPLLGFSQTK